MTRLLVGAVVVGLALVDGGGLGPLPAALRRLQPLRQLLLLLRQQPVQRDGGVVGSEDLRSAPTVYFRGLGQGLNVFRLRDKDAT